MRMRVLFIGNSHTYVNDLPLLVKKILSANEVQCDVTMLSHPGMGLDYHLEQPEMRFNVLYGDYDYVVLQHDAHPFRGAELLTSCVKSLAEIVENTTAKIVLYMTWTEKCNPAGQEDMAKAYRMAAEAVGAKLAPVGIAWQCFRKNFPEYELYSEDGGHACERGSLLAAYTIASVIFEGTRRPSSLPEDCLLYDAAIEAISAEK